MKIVLVSLWYSENMGYSENILPKALAHLGHEVHLVTSTAQVYYNSKFYDQTYGLYLGPSVVPEGSKKIDGYTLHRLPFESRRGIKIVGLIEKIGEIRPDVVQTFDIDPTNVYPIALAKEKYGYRLFTEMHIHASVFPNYKKRSLFERIIWYRSIGRFLPAINKKTALCYPIARDCADIAREMFKVPQSKIKLQSLGTDTQLFKPINSRTEADRRVKTRTQLGFSPTDIICIYTGRITKDKGPSYLAKAIEFLHEKGETQYKGLFVGLGEAEEMNIIRNSTGCVIKDFVPVFDLPIYYQASDIGVWPCQESTSQLDAIASGLPLIINDEVTVKERVEGAGLLYKLKDHEDLADKLLQLKNAEKREILGKAGVEKAVSEFSWLKLAAERVIDYTTHES
jgi:glycosyltransferase involved in cell wall biosynthesis